MVERWQTCYNIIMFNKKNIPLYIALSVPILMILLVAAFIYLPGIGQKPKENFLYVTGNNFYYYGPGSSGYHVSGGKLVYTAPPTTTPQVYPPQNNDPHFYVYNVGKDQADEVTFLQAQNYMLDSSNTSGDGYSIERGNGGGGDFLFGGAPGDYNTWYIKGHNRSRKLNLKLTGTFSYPDNFQFLGWIK